MKMRRVGFIAVLALVGVIGWARTSHAISCFYDSKENGTGELVKWPQPFKTPAEKVPYYINVSKVPAADQAPFEEAIKKAFDAYAAVTCSKLKFEYKGKSTSVSNEPDAILVYFETQASGMGAYFYKLEWNTAAAGDINKGIMMLNANGYSWTVGAAQNKIDVQTAVTQMMPGVIGFYVGDDPWGGSLTSSIKYNYVQTTLTADQIAGVQHIYFDAAGAGCTQPAKPAACKALAPPDGVKKEGPTKTDGVQPTTDGPKPKFDQYKPPTGDAKPTPDYWIWTEAGTVVPPPAKDEGCCRVSHARDTSNAFYALIGAGLVALLLLRRRRR